MFPRGARSCRHLCFHFGFGFVCDTCFLGEVYFFLSFGVVVRTEWVISPPLVLVVDSPVDSHVVVDVVVLGWLSSLSFSTLLLPNRKRLVGCLLPALTKQPSFLALSLRSSIPYSPCSTTHTALKRSFVGFAFCRFACPSLVRVPKPGQEGA